MKAKEIIKLIFGGFHVLYFLGVFFFVIYVAATQLRTLTQDILFVLLALIAYPCAHAFLFWFDKCKRYYADLRKKVQ